MRLLILISMMLLMSCEAPAPVQSSQEQMLVSYIETYNTRDLSGMSELMHPDIKWLSVEGDKIETMADGKQDLTTQMADYFKTAKSQSSVGDIIETGQYLSVIETASWVDGDGKKQSQSALAIYEIKDNLIYRVWYYPAVK